MKRWQCNFGLFFKIKQVFDVFVAKKAGMAVIKIPTKSFKSSSIIYVAWEHLLEYDQNVIVLFFHVE